MTQLSLRWRHSSIRAAIAESHGARSASVSAWPARILATFSGGCRASPSWKLPPGRLRKATVQNQRPGMSGTRVERARHMLVVEFRAVDRFLQVHPVMHMMQEELGRPLVLTVAARRPEGHPGLAVFKSQGRRQGA